MAAGRTWAVKLHRRCRGSHMSSRSINDGENIDNILPFAVVDEVEVCGFSDIGTGDSSVP